MGAPDCQPVLSKKLLETIVFSCNLSFCVIHLERSRKGSLIVGSLANVLKQRRKELGLTLAQIADVMDVSEATVQRWESGNIKSVRHDKIGKLAELLRVTPAYLMGWEDAPAPVISNIVPMPNTYKVPLLGTIACGKPILAVENMDGKVDVPESIHADFALRCKGDSMINARIYDGDIVYIRKQDTVENGEIAAVLIGDEATLKRVKALEDRVILEPANPMYDPLVYRSSDMEEVRILGKAVAFTSFVR